MRIRRTADTMRLDPLVYRPGKIGIFHQARRFAGIIIKPPSLSGLLDATLVHLEDKTVFSLLDDGLDINALIYPETEGPL